MPDQSSVTLYGRGAGDAFDAGVAWRAQRVLPATLDSVDVRAGVVGGDVAMEQQTWRLFKAGQSHTPERGDKITDAGGGLWQIDRVNSRMGRNIYDCEVTKNV